MSDQRPIPQDDWETVVESVPIVSVDLVVRRGDAVLLGRRTNEPAKGRWFVPGGRVHRDERLADAVHRVADEELGVEVDIERRLGAYEHFWAVSDTEDTDGKHYVPVGFVVTTDDDIHTDAQHDAVRWFSPPFDDVDLHPYVHDYLADAELVGE
jgi:colanic acid biosynthesis protein WcaH